jgi:hypothetical protein
MQSRKSKMKQAALLALPEGMEIDQIQITETGLEVAVISTYPQSCCPLCSEPSSHIHSHYHRTLKDAPCVGRQLQLSREPFANSFAVTLIAQGKCLPSASRRWPSRGRA